VYFDTSAVNAWWQNVIASVADAGLAASSIKIAGTNNVLARKRRADNFATYVLPIIEKLKNEGYTSLGSLAQQLNERRIATARGSRWYASTVKNLLDRSKKIR
jgi:hypothetical protein